MKIDHFKDDGCQCRDCRLVAELFIDLIGRIPLSVSPVSAVFSLARAYGIWVGNACNPDGDIELLLKEVSHAVGNHARRAHAICQIEEEKDSG